MLAMLQSLLRLVRPLLGGSPPANPTQSTSSSDVSSSANFALEALLREEFDRCQYFKPEARDRVIRSWLKGESLIRTGTKLSPEQKKALGLNPRMLITQGMVDVLSSEGLKLRDPKTAFSEPAIGATLRLSRMETLQKSLKVGAREFKWRSANDGGDCAWCKRNSGKTFGRDILEQVARHCTCEPHCGGYIEPLFDDLR